MDSIAPPLKWHGGKHYLASRIVALMPEHLHYVEPFFGGGSVLLAKDPEGVSEVVNDIDKLLTTFWRVMACPVQFPRFQRLCEATPFSENEWRLAEIMLEQEHDDEARIAWAFFVRCRQSLAGRMKAFAPVSRSRTRRGMNEQASSWLSAVEGLSAVHARLKRVLVLDARPAVQVVRSEDGPSTLQYLDPPYPHETRADCGAYQHEMTLKDHRELLDAVAQCKGKVMISSYPNGLYDNVLSGWNRHVFDMPNHAAGGKKKRRMEEVVWCNF